MTDIARQQNRLAVDLEHLLHRLEEVAVSGRRLLAGSRQIVVNRPLRQQERTDVPDPNATSRSKADLWTVRAASSVRGACFFRPFNGVDFLGQRDRKPHA
jgi:hypothetical protein